MPRIPRKFVFDPAEVGIYHCINRCVRRAFLCGSDTVSGKCFDHRKEWIQRRLKFLAGQFGIDVLGFAILSNHIHVVVRNRPDIVAGWSDDEVARRWWNIFPQRKDDAGNPAEPADFELPMITASPERLAEVRTRLSSIPWFMRCLGEPIARQANFEDRCSGRFFEGRYRCQPILDEAALTACLAYVDLNPIRAGIAETPETSRFTSVYERIQALGLGQEGSDAQPEQTSADQIPAASPADSAVAEFAPSDSSAEWLSPFELSETEPDNSPLSPRGTGVGDEGATTGSARASNKGCLPMTFAEYLQLLDWTGRQVREDKRGAIPHDLAPVFERLNFSGENWLNLVCDFRRKFRRAAGTPASLTKEAQKRGCRRMHGIVHSRAIFEAPPRRSTA